MLSLIVFFIELKRIAFVTEIKEKKQFFIHHSLLKYLTISLLTEFFLKLAKSKERSNQVNITTTKLLKCIHET